MRVRDVINSPNLVTREAAQRLIAEFENDEPMDFTGIEFVSSAFADELAKQLHQKSQQIEDVIINVDPAVRSMFKVINRRIAVA